MGESQKNDVNLVWVFEKKNTWGDKSLSKGFHSFSLFVILLAKKENTGVKTTHGS
jgi:hypothetical protein